jgi:hypothetical protein
MAAVTWFVVMAKADVMKALVLRVPAPAGEGIL